MAATMANARGGGGGGVGGGSLAAMAATLLLLLLLLAAPGGSRAQQQAGQDWSWMPPGLQSVVQFSGPMLKCWTIKPQAGGPPAEAVVMSFPNLAFLPFACVKYQYKCHSNDKACSEADVKNGVWKWLYMATTADSCRELIARTDTNRNGVCCRTDGCNKPDRKQDPYTRWQE